VNPNRLSDLIGRSAHHELRLEELGRERETTAHQWSDFLFELHKWLVACVHHGCYLPPVAPERRALQGLVDYWTSRILQSGHPMPEFDRLADFDPTAGLPLDDNLFPYFGLFAVDESGSQHFFGRDEQINEYVAHLEGHTALLIQSESGGGKSSVTMAGVIPTLRRKHPDWLVTPRFTPGAHPSRAVEEALAAVSELHLEAGKDASAALSELGERQLLIFVDQLEEVLTVCTNETDQEAFSKSLAGFADSGRVRILATLRSDHYDRFVNSQACRPLFKLLSADNSVKMLPPMSFEQIRSVILKPAQTVGLRYVPLSLIDRLANETANLAGGLPRLQFALQRLWEMRARSAKGESLDLISEESFAQLPNVREALGKEAESVFQGLSDNAGQRACERLMLELTVLDDQLEVPLRRRRFQGDLIKVLTEAKLGTEVQALGLIGKFIDRRLLVRTGINHECQIEVAHESLFRYWPRFQDWIKSDKVRLRLKDVRQIMRDAIQWKQNNDSPDYLKLKGMPLQHALQYRDDNWLDEISSRYCDACDAAEKSEKQNLLEAEKAKRDAENAKIDAAKRKKWISVCVASLAGFLVGIWLYTERLETNNQGTANSFLAIVSHLSPVQAIDLAYTLEKRSPGRFIAPLAHAVDGISTGEVFGPHNLGADFSASGHALLQLARDEKNDKKVTVRVIPIEPTGDRWAKAAEIEFDEDPKINEKVAWIDVGPPIPSETNKRLVVMSFVSEREHSTFTKLVAYWIAPDQRITQGVFEHRYADQTRQVYGVSFEPSGQGAAIAAIQYLPDISPKGQVIVLAYDKNGGLGSRVDELRPSDAANVNNSSAVSAVAYMTPVTSEGPQSTKLIRGRLDGSVLCDKNLIQGPDTSPVVGLLAVSPDSSFVALHASKNIIVGSCDGSDAPRQLLRLSKAQPESLIFRLVPNVVEESHSKAVLSTSGVVALQLSFVSDKSLCQVGWRAGKLPEKEVVPTCWNGLSVDQAIPVFSPTKNAGEFILLPDRNLPFLVNRGFRSRSSFEDVKGVPVAWWPNVTDSGAQTPRVNNIYSSPAASPDLRQAARIVVSTKDDVYIERSQAGNWAKTNVDSGGRPIAVILNNQGTLAVLQETDKQSNRWLKVINPDDTVPRQYEVGKVTCLKLSPDGKNVLVAGDDFENPVIIKFNDPRAIPKGKSANTLAQGASLQACAISNQGIVVYGSVDGKVYYKSPGAQSVLLNAMAHFRSSGTQDVSIDATGSFVALLGKRERTSSVAGGACFPVRIWDIRPKNKKRMPVASACLPYEDLVAIGPLEQRSGAGGRWALPVFATSQEKIRRLYFDCLACTDNTANGIRTVSESLTKLARDKYWAKPLSEKEVSNSYGIELK
jgi:hypothetical protein